MRASDRLRLTLRLVEPRLDRAGAALWLHPRLPALLPAYFTRLVASMRAAIDVMEAAAERCRALAPGDEVAARLVPYWERHIEEERGHDLWVLEDLAALGHDASAAATAAPTPDVAELMGTLYYWIHHAHPVGLLGYFALIEGTPVPEATLDEVRRRHGLPRASLRAFYRHAVMDREHGDELFALLDRLPLRREHERSVGLTAITSAGQLSRILEALVDGAEAAA